MLRLTRTSLDTSEVVLNAEGQIVGEWVTLLESECRELLASERLLQRSGTLRWSGPGDQGPSLRSG
jgi:hypothetical protein